MHYNIKTVTNFQSNDTITQNDVKVYVNNKIMNNSNISIKSVPTLNNYTHINNIHFNSTGLPEKLRSHYRYNIKCPIQSAWNSYYDSK